MEFLLRHIDTAVAGFLAILLFLYLVQKRSSSFRRNDSRISPPEAAGRWPIIGHLHLLAGGSPLPHKTLANLADKCGPIFTIRIGSHRGLVVSSSEMAKECFTINDLASASRPNLLAAKQLGYNYAMFGLAPHGPFWREIRKIATVQLLSNRRLELLKHIRISEVASFVKELYEHWTTKWNDNDHSGQAPVEMKQRFSDLTLNVTLRMVAGKRYSIDANDGGDVKQARLVQKEIKEFSKLLGLFVPGDAIPYLGWLDLGGCEKAMKKTAKALDGIVGEWLEEHKQNRAEMNNEEKKEQDFIDVMLSILHGSDFGGFDADTIIKATILTLIAGGSDTNALTLTWAVSLLLNNRHVLKKAQDELDSQVGKNRAVNELDMHKLTYIQAIVKETLRLYPAAPLSGPHVFLEDCTIGGYHVAKGTRLITNIWKIQTDPILWPDPFEFKPEKPRFLTTNKDVDVRGQHFELIPFGSGRRACPGISFALQMVQFTLASFLQAFDISTPLNAPVDMTESFGLTNTKATPLEVLFTLRLPAELYA